MTLTAILIFGVGAALYQFLPRSARLWALLIGSVVAIYWMQPPLSIAPLTFILPTTTLLLGVIGWWISCNPRETDWGEHNRLTLSVVVGTVVVLTFVSNSLAFVNIPIALMPAPPPDLLTLIFGVVIVGATLYSFTTLISDKMRFISVFVILIIIIFAALKIDTITIWLSMWLRSVTSRPLFLAQPQDIQWLGFSYVAFRLIHTLRDSQSGRLPALNLRDYLIYLIFFPAYTAGPIDRAERFHKDLIALDSDNELRPEAARIVEGGSRIAIGIFKKFVVANSLAAFALNATNATQIAHGVGGWLLLYGYSFQIFFDFSGYSDIAIGIGILFGIRLPENFDHPYLKESLTAFWQSWYMTLSTWARHYVFTPLSRQLMNRPQKLPPNVIVLLTQLATMITIGLWHDITFNFVMWGIWHGIGLWLHKLYTDRTRSYYQSLKDRPRWQQAVRWGGILFTFHYVALGWVWFALPTPDLSITVFRRLLGL